jgi:hypothetical protein
LKEDIKPIQLNKIAMDNIDLPTNMTKYDENTQKLILEYLRNLSDVEMKAYKIAKAHLGSSFNLVKSNGFCDWIKNKK